MQAHPDNRLVADVLEAEWNARLRALDDARRELEERRAEDPGRLDDARRQHILSLATDFPRLWNDPATPDRERKRMARLLTDDVTITRDAEIALGQQPSTSGTMPIRVDTVHQGGRDGLKFVYHVNLVDEVAAWASGR